MARSFGRVKDRGSVEVKSGGRNLFLRLERGDNDVRLFGDTFRTWIHWFVDTNGDKRRANCAGDGCPLCRASTKPETDAKQRFYNACITRATNSVQILDMGSQIFQGIQALDGDVKWGPVDGYDINIKKGKKGENPLYKVIANPKEDLSKVDKALIKASAEIINLDKLTAPSTIDQIEAAMRGEKPQKSAPAETDDSEDEAPGGDAEAPAAKKEKKKASKAKDKSKTEEELDDFFDV